MSSERIAMAAAYVQISRDDLEEWLDSIHLPKHWKRKAGKAGIYLIPLSDAVAIKLSSTIGTADDAMGRGQASMNLALVSLVTDRVLNKKAMGQARFHRTTNWRKTWHEGIKRMDEAYLKGKGFYEALAVIDDREKYEQDTLALIESVPGWQHNSMLSDFHKNIQQGGILVGGQMAALQKLVHGGYSSPTAPPVVTPSTVPAATEALLVRLRKLYDIAKANGDDYLLGFASTIGPKVKAGQPLSQKQEAFMHASLTKYKLASAQNEALISRISATWLSRNSNRKRNIES